MFPSSFPTPALYRPGAEPRLRWGIVAPSAIAGDFLSALHEHTEQHVVAIASRAQERADAFAARFGIESAYGSFERLLLDPSIDVVYVAAPNHMHAELGLQAIEAGKHVLIEKPFATNAPDAAALVVASRRQGTFLMEAMWTRYLPQTLVLRQLLADGAIGPVQTVVADLGHGVPAAAMPNLYDPARGGGALLDLGVYCVQLASLVLGRPAAVHAFGALAPTGVDVFSTAVARYPGGEQATLMCSISTRTPSRACIAGLSANLEIAGQFQSPAQLTLTANERFGTSLTWDDPTGLRAHHALSWQATALARFVGEGRTESPEHTLDETVQIMETLDEIARQVRLQDVNHG
jgi:predicted dehydrogenase